MSERRALEPSMALVGLAHEQRAALEHTYALFP